MAAESPTPFIPDHHSPCGGLSHRPSHCPQKARLKRPSTEAIRSVNVPKPELDPQEASATGGVVPDALGNHDVIFIQSLCNTLRKLFEHSRKDFCSYLHGRITSEQTPISLVLVLGKY